VSKPTKTQGKKIFSRYVIELTWWEVRLLHLTLSATKLRRLYDNVTVLNAIAECSKSDIPEMMKRFKSKLIDALERVIS